MEALRDSPPSNDTYELRPARSLARRGRTGPRYASPSSRRLAERTKDGAPELPPPASRRVAVRPHDVPAPLSRRSRDRANRGAMPNQASPSLHGYPVHTVVLVEGLPFGCEFSALVAVDRCDVSTSVSRGLWEPAFTRRFGASAVSAMVAADHDKRRTARCATVAM